MKLKSRRHQAPQSRASPAGQAPRVAWSDRSIS